MSHKITTYISSNNNSFALKVLEYAESNNCQFMQLCGKIEMEISKLENDDKIEFLNMYNLKDSALNHLIQLYRLNEELLEFQSHCLQRLLKVYLQYL